jgi:hypothetical protein
MSQDKKENKKSKLRRNILVVFFLLIVIGLISLYLYAQKPAQGIIKSTPSEKNIETVALNVPQAFTGEYLSFLFDKTYSLKSHDVTDKSGDVILERAYLSETGSISKKIGLMVRSLPTRNLNDVPDYKMRDIKTESYKKAEFDFGNVAGVSFEALGEETFEKTFFILNKDKVAILTMTAPSFSNEEIQNELETIVRSISWLK